jgi:hypothetical protein
MLKWNLPNQLNMVSGIATVDRQAAVLRYDFLLCKYVVSYGLIILRYSEIVNKNTAIKRNIFEV